MLWPDAMQLDIKAAEPHAWVHKGCESFNPIVRPDAGYANLTYAGGVTAGSLDVKSDEPEISTWQFGVQVIAADGSPVAAGPKIITRALW